MSPAAPLRRSTTRARSGFTLIELLTVVLIIGILAGIAVQKYTRSKEQSYIASLKSDLRNLASAQENYLGEHSTYTAVVADLSGAFTPTDRVTFAITASNETWSAVASHGATNITCYLDWDPNTLGLITCQ